MPPLCTVIHLGIQNLLYLVIFKKGILLSSPLQSELTLLKEITQTRTFVASYTKFDSA